MTIEDCLKQGEGKKVEFKRDLSSPEPIIKTLIAFANSAGGTLLIGVDDETRDVLGVQNPLKEEERLANWIADRIQPKLIPEIEICAWRSTQLIRVHVFPSSLRPHWLKRIGRDRGTFVRIGSTNRQADSALITSLMRSIHSLSFDESPLPELSSEAIDFRVPSELFAEQGRNIAKKELNTLGVLTPVQGKHVPTVGGLLLFGRDHRATFPDAWMQCGRFKGTTRADIVDHTDLCKPIALLPDAAMEFMKKHALRGLQIRNARGMERWSVPMDAVRESVINALVHADYSLRGTPIRLSIYDDRLTVESPGFLLPGLTVEDILSGVSRLRNRVIARVFRELELIEQWGSGIPRIVRDCKEYGLSPPLFEEMATGFRLTIYLGREGGHVPIKEKDVLVLRYIESQEKGASTAAIASHFGISTRTVRNRVGRLTELGLLAPIGSNQTDPKRRYVLTEEGRMAIAKP